MAMVAATFSGWGWFVALAFLPLAAVIALIGAFQQAKGAGCGQVAAVLGWVAGAYAPIAWSYVNLS
jgi:hypothetical protein